MDMGHPEKQAVPINGPEPTFRCEVAASDLEAFVACLALGTLEAMKSGTWPPEAGTWTLARPIFVRSLESSGLSKELLDVLQRADELSALESLSGRSAVNVELDKMIGVVRTHLAASASTTWRARWFVPDASPNNDL